MRKKKLKGSLTIHVRVQSVESTRVILHVEEVGPHQVPMWSGGAWRSASRSSTMLNCPSEANMKATMPFGKFTRSRVGQW